MTSMLRFGTWALICLNVCFLTVLNCEVSAAGDPVHSFTAAHTIEMTHLAEPDSSADGALVKMSPDGKHFAVVTRRGNLITGLNDYELLLYNTEETLRFLNSQIRDRPRGQILVQLSSAMNTPAIQSLRWQPDSRHIAFLGQAGSEVSQVYKVGIDGGPALKMTAHERNVESFVISPATGSIVYISSAIPRNDVEDQPSFVVGVRTIHDLILPELAQKFWPRKQFYVREPGKSARQLGEPFDALFVPPVWISPDGQRAVVLLPTGVAPKTWLKRYPVFGRSGSYGQRVAAFDSDHMKSDLLLRKQQYFWIDLQRETISPVFDAPSGQFTGPFSATAMWMPNGSSIILGNTFLPLDGVDEKEMTRRAGFASIIEYDFELDTITRIVDVPEFDWKNAANTERFTSMELSANGVLTINRRTRLKPLSPLRFIKTKRGWRKPDNGEYPVNTEAPARTLQRLTVSIAQDLDEAPELSALDSETGRQKAITDLNPHFRELTFGKAEQMEWTDRESRTWVGGLIYPVGFESGRRYPLLIQTHGFRADQFLVDGAYGMSSVFAAQALANKGMFVLQAPDNAESLATPRELEIHRLGFEAAIDELDRRGFIDRTKVGIIGFSRTGLYAEHMITFSDYEFAAATIADSISVTHWGYASIFGYGMTTVEGILGGVPWGETLDEWVERNPGLHTDRIHTPLRLESYNNYVFERWDTYAFLRRQHKPVELIRIPSGDHNLVKPLERLASLQGNVDWFSFWLLGEENPDPAKANQNERWRRLKELHSKDLEAVEAGMNYGHRQQSGPH